MGATPTLAKGGGAPQSRGFHYQLFVTREGLDHKLHLSQSVSIVKSDYQYSRGRGPWFGRFSIRYFTVCGIAK
jgi:hypothetical protein